jgi:hypothetical protein
MTIFSKRNALVGAIAIFFARLYARRKLRGVRGRLGFGR